MVEAVSQLENQVSRLAVADWSSKPAALYHVGGVYERVSLATLNGSRQINVSCITFATNAFLVEA